MDQNNKNNFSPPSNSNSSIKDKFNTLVSWVSIFGFVTYYREPVTQFFTGQVLPFLKSVKASKISQSSNVIGNTVVNVVKDPSSWEEAKLKGVWKVGNTVFDVVVEKVKNRPKKIKAGAGQKLFESVKDNVVNNSNTETVVLTVLVLGSFVGAVHLYRTNESFKLACNVPIYFVKGTVKLVGRGLMSTGNLLVKAFWQNSEPFVLYLDTHSFPSKTRIGSLAISAITNEQYSLTKYQLALCVGLSVTTQTYQFVFYPTDPKLESYPADFENPVCSHFYFLSDDLDLLARQKLNLKVLNLKYHQPSI